MMFFFSGVIIVIILGCEEMNVSSYRGNNELMCYFNALLLSNLALDRFIGFLGEWEFPGFPAKFVFFKRKFWRENNYFAKEFFHCNRTTFNSQNKS
jgi:hypothetical protein